LPARSALGKQGEFRWRRLWQEQIYDSPQPLPKLVNLFADLREERDVGAYKTWVAHPMMQIVTEFRASLKRYPRVPSGTPDPYVPANCLAVSPFQPRRALQEDLVCGRAWREPGATMPGCRCGNRSKPVCWRTRRQLWLKGHRSQRKTASRR
jgi:hypothetical protein